MEISDFTPSSEALGHLSKEEEEDDAYERFLVWRDEGTYEAIGCSYGQRELGKRCLELR